MTEPLERLQKVLARAGLGSRRQVDEWVSAGRIQVNGKVAEPGIKINGTERIEIDGKPVRLNLDEDEVPLVLAYHKPVGEICSRDDPEHKNNVFSSLPRVKTGRWISVGRLDLNTAGLLLFTTDGELANRLMHPSSEIEREYAVRILGEVDMPMLTRLIEGVELEDGKARFTAIEESGGSGANHWYHVIIKEGRNREVRRLWESQGVTVSRLSRVRYGSVILERKQREGKWRLLEDAEARTLYESVGLAFKGSSNCKSQLVKKNRSQPRAKRKPARRSARYR